MIACRKFALTHNYRSGFERSIAANLKRRNVQFQYETLELAYTLCKTYRPDFILPNGIIVEAKGVLTPADRTKMKAVKDAHPELDIRMLFMDASKKLSKRAKMTYGRWAEVNGFIWAEGTEIPKEWLK